MSDYKGSIGLIDGNRINLLDDYIDPNLIKIDQIANALSKKCRFNGQIADFYSVAEHCVHVAEFARDNAFSTLSATMTMTQIRPIAALRGLAGLLHDASEAYMSDFVTPLKVLFPEYIKLEEKLQRIIFEKYDVPLNLLDEIHANIDYYASYIEMRQMGTHDWTKSIQIPQEYYFEVRNWMPDEARREYMQCYTSLYHQLKRW